MKEHKEKKEVWTRMDEWKSTKVARVPSDFDYNKDSVHLASLIDMVEILEVFFD